MNKVKGPNRCCILGGRISSSLNTEHDSTLSAALCAAKFREGVLAGTVYIGLQRNEMQRRLLFCISYSLFQPASTAYPAYTM